MADDCDPTVLHARVCVLESDNKRHDTDINQLFGKVSALEVCASSLPEIKDRLIDIQEQVANLHDCSIQNEAKVDTLTAIWRAINQPVTMSAAIVLFMAYQYFAGA
jgi:hypothetical protein